MAGVPYMDPSIFAAMELREGDVFVSTGCKQGTTWSCCIMQREEKGGEKGGERARNKLFINDYMRHCATITV
jgi:hypothetical protein